MKLYTHFIAPNPIKVELYLAEKKALGCEIPLEKQVVALQDAEQKSPEITKRNPRQRTPFLELDDGTVLTESLSIIEYLEELWPEPSLTGTSPLERAEIRSAERSIDFDILHALGIIGHAINSPIGYAKVPEVADWMYAYCRTSHAVLNDKLSDGRPFVMGDQVTIADCTLAAGLQFGRFAGALPSPDLKHITSWDEKYRARDAVRDIFIA